jgi:hypothetical protein
VRSFQASKGRLFGSKQPVLPSSSSASSSSTAAAAALSPPSDASDSKHDEPVADDVDDYDEEQESDTNDDDDDDDDDESLEDEMAGLNVDDYEYGKQFENIVTIGFIGTPFHLNMFWIHVAV